MAIESTIQREKDVALHGHVCRFPKRKKNGLD